MSSPTKGTGLSVVTDRIWSLGLFYQTTNSNINESKHLDGVWTNQKLNFSATNSSPLASVTYNSGKEVTRPLTSFRRTQLTRVW